MTAKTPRRVRWHATANTLLIAAYNVSKPEPRDIDEIMAVMRAAARAMREGVATDMHWAVLSGHVEMALAIERQGIVRGLNEHWTSAGQVLETIAVRAKKNGDWQSPTLYFSEIDTLTTFLDLHHYQIKQLSRSEYSAAIKSARSHIRNDGFRVGTGCDLVGVAA